MSWGESMPELSGLKKFLISLFSALFIGFMYLPIKKLSVSITTLVSLQDLYIGLGIAILVFVIAFVGMNLGD